MTVGLTIRALRKKRGLTQAELGALCGVNAALICSYERGRTQPKRQALEKLAAALEVSVSRLTSENARSDAGNRSNISENFLGVLKQLCGGLEEVTLLDSSGNSIRYYAAGHLILRESDAAALAQAARAALLSTAEWKRQEARVSRRKLG